MLRGVAKWYSTALRGTGQPILRQLPYADPATFLTANRTTSARWRGLRRRHMQVPSTRPPCSARSTRALFPRRIPADAGKLSWTGSTRRKNLGLTDAERSDLTAYLETVGAADEPYEAFDTANTPFRLAFSELTTFASTLDTLLRNGDARAHPAADRHRRRRSCGRRQARWPILRRGPRSTRWPSGLAEVGAAVRAEDWAAAETSWSLFKTDAAPSKRGRFDDASLESPSPSYSRSGRSCLAADACSGAVCPLRLAFIPQENPDKLLGDIEAITAWLASEIGVPVEGFVTIDHAAAVEALRNGDADISFMGALPFVLAERPRSVPSRSCPRSTAMRPVIRAAVFVRRDSGFKTLADLRRSRHRLCRPDLGIGISCTPSPSLSAQAVSSPDAAEDFFGRIFFAGGYQQAMQAMAEGSGRCRGASQYADLLLTPRAASSGHVDRGKRCHSRATSSSHAPGWTPSFARTSLPR